jgi:hypothetical protein
MRPALGLERPQGGSPLENRHENGPRHARSLAVPVRGTVFDSKLIINYDSIYTMIYTTINRNTTRVALRLSSLTTGVTGSEL